MDDPLNYSQIALVAKQKAKEDTNQKQNWNDDIPPDLIEYIQ